MLIEIFSINSKLLSGKINSRQVGFWYSKFQEERKDKPLAAFSKSNDKKARYLFIHGHEPITIGISIPDKISDIFKMLPDFP